MAEAWLVLGGRDVSLADQPAHRRLHEVIEEVLVAILVARLCKIIFRHHVIVGVGLLP